jgi:hypothetical protein
MNSAKNKAMTRNLMISANNKPDMKFNEIAMNKDMTQHLVIIK